MPAELTDAEIGIEPELTDADVGLGLDQSGFKLSPYDQATMDRGGVKPPSGMESGTELTTALGQAGMRVAAPVLEPVNRALSYAGNVARAIPADIAESVAGNEKYYDMLNLGAAALGEPMPIDEQLKEASSESPGWAVTGKVAQGIAGMIPTVMAFGGLPAAAQKVALAGFTVKQLSDFKDASSQLGDELGKPKEQQDPDKITSLVSELAQTGLFAGAGIYGGRKMIAPNIKAPPARIGMPAPELTGAEKIARPGVFAPDQLRAGPLRWAGEPLPLPTGMAPAPSTAQLAPPAQRDLSAQGQIDALMREGRGPAPSTATPPTDLARTAPAPGTGLAPEGRGRPFDPKFPQQPVPPPATPVPAPTPPKPSAPAGAEAVMPDISFLEKPMGSHGPEEIAAMPDDVWGAAMRKKKGVTWSMTADATAWAMNQKSTPELLTRLKELGDADTKKAIYKGEFPQKAQWYQDAAHALVGDEVGLSNVTRIKEMAAKGLIKIKPPATPAPSAEPIKAGSTATPVPTLQPAAEPTPPPAAPKPVAPASSVGLSVPVDVTQPLKPKRAYNMASLRAPADEFKQLVLEHGIEHGWISAADMDKIVPELRGVKRGHSSASMAATVAMNNVLKPAYLKALADLGIKTDNNTLKLHAEALPKLKSLLEKHAAMVPIPLAQMPDGSKFTKLGEEHTVANTNTKTGIVTIKDGITLKVHMDDSVKIDPGSLRTPEAPKPQGPQIAQGVNQTDMLDATQKDTLSLAGEVQGDPARIATEAKAKADSAAAAKALAAKQQPDLFGQPPSAKPAPLVNPPDVTLELGAGIPIPRFLDEAATKAAEYVGELYREELKAPKMNDRRRAVLNWSAKLQRSFGEAAAKQRDILKRVPSPIRRDGITNWIQADGDAATLAQRRADTASWRDPATGKPHPDAKRLLAGYDAALHLTPEEIAVANQVKGDYARFAARGQAADVLDTLKDNYVTQTWNLGRGPGGTGSSRTLKEKFRFSRASTFANYFEGEQAGYSPKTKDISKLLPMYSHEMNAVIAARQLVAEMGQGVASDGRPLLAPKGIGIPVDDPVKGEATLVMPKVGDKDIRDYKVLANQPALSKWKWVSKDSEGNPVMLKADLALHPEAFKHLQAILGRSAIRDWYGTRTTALAAIPKGIVHGIDWANSETKRTMLGMLATFHQVQTGTHAIGHRVNPFFSIPKVDLVGNPLQMDAARHGLMMLPDRASENQFMEGFKASGLVSRIPAIGPISDWYSHYLFSEYIPGLKFKTYQAILERNLKVYDRQITSGRVSGADIKVLSAEQANAAYGHLNYADLGRNPTIQHIMQLGLLAPDFLEARGRFAGQAIKGLTGAKVGREQLLALATLAIAQSALAYTSAKITGGEWDKKRPFEFTLGNRRYTMRSVPEDLQNLITDTRKFAHARLSPIIGKGTLQYATGVDYRGRKISAGQTTKELATQPIPLSIRGFAGIGQSTLSGLEQLAGTIGLRISRYSPMMDMHDLIVDFKKNSNDPKLKADVELQEQEVFASPYEKLRNVLHSGDLASARKEYDKLAGIRTTKQIDNAMKPWTGGNLNVKTLTMSPAKPKPFTGSPKIEQAFVQSLTPEQQKTYQKATAERAKFYQTFQDMLRTTKETERELTDAEVGITP